MFFDTKELKELRESSDPKHQRMMTRIKIFAGMAVAILVLIIGVVVLFKNNASLKIQIKKQNEQLTEATDKISEIIKYVPQMDYSNESTIEDEGYVTHTEKDDPTQFSVRLTSYYTGDDTGSTKYTGSGISTDRFKTNDKGWYTYNGKVVLAAATKECLNSSKGACGQYNYSDKVEHYFSYFDELTITVDNQDYQAVVLDSCGACMRDSRVDMFVKDKDSVVDRGYLGNNPAVIQIKKSN